LKRGILADLADLLADDPWQSWSDHAADLGLGTEDIGTVMDELRDEMNRRVDRFAPLTTEAHPS